MGRFACDKCQYKTKINTNFRIHQRTHSEENLFSCGQCLFVTYYPASLSRHKLLHLTAEKPLCCDKCDFKTYYSSKLKAHTQNNEKPFSRDYCAFETRCLRSLNDNKIRLFQCKECNNSYTSKKRLEFHKQRKHNQFDCKECGYYTRVKQHLRRHESPEENNPSRSKCQHCEKEFKFHACLDYHLETYHRMEEEDVAKRQKYIKCRKCEDIFGTRSGLHHHLRTIHMGELRYNCLYCNYATNILDRFTKHEIMKHHTKYEGAPNGPYLCEVCGKHFSTKLFFNLHGKIAHQEEKKYSCQDCDYSTNQRRHLTRHLYKYLHKYDKSSNAKTKLQRDLVEDPLLSDGNLKCILCGDILDNAILFLEHEMKHSFSCADCGKIYWHRSRLKQHKLQFHDVKIRKK